MSVPRFKRRPSGLDYVDNAFELQKEIMTLASKLSARWARIYQQPVDKLACLQADLVNMAYSINPTTAEDYITRRWLLKMSKANLQALERRLMDMIRILYMNPSKCFSRKNGKIINVPDRDTIYRQRRKIRKMYKISLNALEIEISKNSVIAYLKQGNSYKYIECIRNISQ